jgi:sterol carrier protein 2
MGKIAIERALTDAGLPYSVIEQAACGYVYGDSTCGQRALYEVGITGIPVYNVNNNCSTGSTALFMARQFIQSGLNQCVLAFGFEKMEKGSLKAKWEDRTNPLDKHVSVMVETHGITKAPFAPQLFGNAGKEHMQKYGSKLEHFAKIAEKNHRHSANNPYSQFQDVYTLDQILKSKMVFEPLTMLQCCPTSEGAGAAILASEEFVYKYGLQNRAVEIAGMAMATDFKSSFDEGSMIKAVGFDMTKSATHQAFAQAGMTVNDVQVVELHDCFSANELLTYEALGLCPIGKAADFIDKGDNTYGGKYVVNPSGGLISKGHPLGATGLAQCAELCWQIRGQADKRQVKNVTGALQHNLGLGGAVVVTVYKKAKFSGIHSIPVAATSRAESVGEAPAVAATTPSSSTNAPAGSVTKPETKAPAAGGNSSLKSDAVFNQLRSQLSADVVSKVKATFRFDVSPDNGGSTTSYFVDLKSGSGKIELSDTKADCIIAIKDSDLVSLLGGQLNPQKAFMEGKLKIKGNMMLAQKLTHLMPAKSKL